MTTFWSNWKIQEETGLEFEYQRVPDNINVNKSTRMTVDPDGYAEIKPHNKKGITEGLQQLSEHPTDPRVLITYLPLIGPGKPAIDAYTGQPTEVRVFATHFKQGMTPGKLLKNTQLWWDLGSYKPPGQIRLTLENRGLFGAAIEPWVRDLFCCEVLDFSGRKMWTGTGGQRPGADVRWHELADLYAELGRELRDPLYAELALMLTEPKTAQLLPPTTKRSKTRHCWRCDRFR